MPCHHPERRRCPVPLASFSTGHRGFRCQRRRYRGCAQGRAPGEDGDASALVAEVVTAAAAALVMNAHLPAASAQNP